MSKSSNVQMVTIVESIEMAIMIQDRMYPVKRIVKPILVEKARHVGLDRIVIVEYAMIIRFAMYWIQAKHVLLINNAIKGLNVLGFIILKTIMNILVNNG